MQRAAAEALAFAEALGLAAADCWQVLREGAAASFMFDCPSFTCV